MPTRSNTIRLALLVAAAGALSFSSFSTPSVAQEKPKPKSVLAAEANKVIGDEINDAQKAAVKKGLKWLSDKRKQSPNFAQNGFGNHAGITALCGLAFMQQGNLPGRGEYGEDVQAILDYVLNCCTRSGLITSDASSGPMYGHGFAALFLGEVYGMTRDDNVKEKLQKAIQLIQKTQNAEGGWRYQPAPYDADISVTICQVMALRAARDAGIQVSKEVIDKSIEYVKRCQNPDGGFNYMANQGPGGSGFPRSAAGVAALYYAGIFDGPQIEKGLDYLKAFMPGKGDARGEGHYFYGHYYAVQANFLAGGEYWKNWFPAIRDELCKRQAADGSWNGDFNEEYCTSMALIILQMPNRYLPVYAGKGPGS